MAWVSPQSLNPDNIEYCNGVKVYSYILKKHNINNIELPSKRNKAFKGVVIHNTNRAKSADEGRQYTAATLNGAMASRTHYYVSETGAWQNLELTDMNWTCGDGVVGQGNNGCISLEIIMDTRDKEIDLKARDNGARLAAWLLWKNNMDVNDMYTHNYFLNIRNGVTGDYNKLCTTATPTRNCPYYIVHDWEGFRNQVTRYINDLKKVTVPSKENKEQNSQNVPKIDKSEQVKTKKYVFRAISQAAIRESTSKLSKLYKRVTRGDYYIAELVENNKWLKHIGLKGYSMMNDGGALFEEVGECICKTAKVDVNVRSAPTTESNKIATISKGSILYVVNGRSVKVCGHTWLECIINNKLGYVASEYLKDE